MLDFFRLARVVFVAAQRGAQESLRHGTRDRSWRAQKPDMTARMSLIYYRAASLLATPLAGPMLAWRLRRGKEDRQRIGERRGLTRLSRPPGPLVWLHGASLGEAAVLLPFVERITRTGATALVTTETLRSAAMLARRLPPGAIHQYAPLDHPLLVRRFLKHWRPDAALVAGSEFWPNMIVEFKRFGSTRAMVNRRIRPSFWRQCLTRILGEEGTDEALGDLEEVYRKDCVRRGERYARRRYIVSLGGLVVRHLWRAALRKSA